MSDKRTVQKGDLISWREQQYVVTAVYKRTVHLCGVYNDVKLRCETPIAEGGFDEAKILGRAACAKVLVEPVTV
jgi:hypothetical protein